MLAAIDGLSPGADEALAQLCRTYWFLLYAFVRRRGHSPHDAQDLTQDSFAHPLEKDALKTVGLGLGKFRSFLLAVLTNFLNNEWNKERTLKRGRNVQLIPWDEVGALVWRIVIDTTGWL